MSRARARRLAIALWIAMAVVVWNGLYDLRITLGVRDYLMKQALHDAGRGPAVTIADAMRDDEEGRRAGGVAVGRDHPCAGLGRRHADRCVHVDAVGMLTMATATCNVQLRKCVVFDAIDLARWHVGRWQ